MDENSTEIRAGGKQNKILRRPGEVKPPRGEA